MQKVTVREGSNPVHANNYFDSKGNPSGGYAHSVGMCIAWQDGPRGRLADGSLAPANGAFVEDAIVAARERLDFFQQSQYAHPANAEAIDHLNRALDALAKRTRERVARQVEGQNIV